MDKVVTSKLEVKMDQYMQKIKNIKEVLFRLCGTQGSHYVYILGSTYNKRVFVNLLWNNGIFWIYSKYILILFS